VSCFCGRHEYTNQLVWKIPTSRYSVKNHFSGNKTVETRVTAQTVENTDHEGRMRFNSNKTLDVHVPASGE
jgi:hypothetical protein